MTPGAVRIAVTCLVALTVAIVLLRGPLRNYVPSCPVTFGFCMDRAQ